jgi:hypothetical protein
LDCARFPLPQELRLVSAYGLRRWLSIWSVLNSLAYVLQVAGAAPGFGFLLLPPT